MFKIKNHQSVFDQILDHPQTFPKEIFNLLRDHQLMSISLPKNFRESLKHTFNENQDFWDVLYELGRGDLSVGRIFEGHVNALLLIDTYGNLQQRSFYFAEASKGKIFGVWNTERSFEGLKLNRSNDVMTLEGAKTYCSGALNIQFPIVTALSSKGHQMLVLDLEKHRELREDWSLWNPTGMCASVSCRFDFTGVKINRNQNLGNSGDYYREPIFSWGATRFSVVQLGAAKHIVEIVVSHLTEHRREKDCHQEMRLGKMAILIETADLWLARVKKIDKDFNEISNDKKVNFANMMRTITLDICTEIITLAEKSVGLQGMMIRHPLEKTVRDLRVYMRQAGPDLALSRVGANLAKTVL